MLELRNLSFEVASKKVLRRINYIFLPNNIYVITGKNGSGKSTLAKLIMGLEKINEGAILLNGKDLSRQSVSQRAKNGIGLSFQQPVSFRGLTVYDLLNIATNKTLDETHGADLLAQVGLDSTIYLRRDIDDKLSGGELKRIELATVIARDPKVAIFDEPEAGIDLWSFADLVKVFKLLKAADRIIIIVSHQDKILRLADKILLLKNGEIAEFDDYKKFRTTADEGKNERN